MREDLILAWGIPLFFQQLRPFLTKCAQQVRNEKNHQYASQPDACSARVTPVTMSVVPATATDNQCYDDNE